MGTFSKFVVEFVKRASWHELAIVAVIAGSVLMLSLISLSMLQAICSVGLVIFGVAAVVKARHAKRVVGSPSPNAG